MFDIGFWELGLIGVVALLVIGPERLPAVARTVGMWLGRGRRFIASVQADINQEIGKADDLKRLLEEQSRIQSTHEIIEQTADEVREGLAVPTRRAVQPPPEYVLGASHDEPTPASDNDHKQTQAQPRDDVKHDPSA